MQTTERPALELRPYQRDAIDRTNAAHARGVRRQLGVAATGTGKTIIFCALAREMGGRALVLVHRDELVRQAYQKVREVWPDVDVGIVKANDDDIRAQVVIASVQTLSRERRLQRMLDAMSEQALIPVEPFALVVVDEAHHTAADSYQRILDAFPESLILGVTATPDRGDGKGLDDLFDEIVWNYDILWGIRAGYLCDVRGLQIHLSELDLSNVKKSRGDFEAGAAGKAMQDAHAPVHIVKAWKRHAPDRRTLVFTPTVALAQTVAELFRAEGVSAGWVSGETPMDERRATLAAYGRGEIQVCVNCAVLLEGYDEPRTDCVVMARPTQSRALYTQAVGRGTRKHPDKTDLLVLDVVGASEEHSLITVPSLLGIPKKFAKRLGDGTGTLSDVAQEYDDHQVAVGKMRHEDANLFRQLRGQGIAWVQLHVAPDEQKRYQRTLSHRDRTTGESVALPTVMIVQKADDDESWLCGLVMPDGKKRVLMADVSLELAQGVGEDAVRKLVGNSQLVNPNAAWRRGKPSPKARRAAFKWGMEHVEQYKTAGELSDALDAHIARKTGRHR